MVLIVRGVLFFSLLLVPLIGQCQEHLTLAMSQGKVRISLPDVLLEAITNQSWSANEWHEFFPIYVSASYDQGILQSVAGTYQLEKNILQFAPLFAFAQGQQYCAYFHYYALAHRLGIALAPDAKLLQDDTLELTFAIPDSNVSPTVIKAVYPEADSLPENTLRMYIYFSAPMSTGNAYSYIQLLDDHGNRIERPFLVVDQELWDSSRQRFTLLFDPGRIKRGIKSNLDLGGPLQQGKSYQIIIDSTWRDERGRDLAQRYKRNFFVIGPERTSLTTARWKIIMPAKGSLYPLTVQFEKPLDHALALKYIGVAGPLQNVVEGQSKLDQYDKHWTFTPATPWRAGKYTLLISPLLEDPSGNNFKNAFEVDLGVSTRFFSDDALGIEFEIRR